MKILNIFWISLILSGLNIQAQESATSILKKVDNTVFSVKDKSAEVVMVMTNLKNNNKKIKKAILLQKGADKKIFRYTYPKSDEGIATLTLPGAVYLYMPMFKKPKKITNMAESNAMNKSDFSLKDADTKPYAQVYTAQLLKTEKDVYVLDLKPKSSDSPYSHLVATFNKTYYYPVKVEYYNKKNEKIKVALHHFVKINGYWTADKVSMEDLKKKHKTEIFMTNIKLNQGLKDDLFTPENLVPKK